MDRCPVCRAALNGATTCRRCRTDWTSALRTEQLGVRLMDAAMHCLALDDVDEAMRLTRRAHLVHATVETRVIMRICGESGVG